MSVRSEFPHSIREIDNIWIPLSDGTRLAARIWLPVDAEEHPVPAILEYLPYRKDDMNASQDSTRHPYFAGFGYAGVRVDIRGTGDSDGILMDEYLAQEQDDALEVIAWLAEQPWCSGEVGMIGYSWGGFNGLQIAARRPAALKAIVTMYSTDDRYRDDCHYAGGCMLGSDMLKWASWMRLYNALPPDPAYRDDWRDVWRERLERTPAYIEPWLEHQTRDDYWKHGSVCEDYAAIRAATLVVGGWADAYTNAVPRLLEHLTCERKGIIGPWAHVVPYHGVPGPNIGILQESLRWFDRWLKGAETGVEQEPLLRVWIQESVRPASRYEARPGRWITQNSWPPEGVETQAWELGPGPVLHRPGWVDPSGLTVIETKILASPQHTGQTAGVWCANGKDAELPEDQRLDDELSVRFDSEPLSEPLELLGVPAAHLIVMPGARVAIVAVRLCEVFPDGASTLVSWGQLNLTHAESDEEPHELDPKGRYAVRVPLNAVGQRVAAGNRLRLAVSSAYWPHAWPHAVDGPVVMLSGGGSKLELPVLVRPGPELMRPFGDPEHSADRAEHPESQRVRLRHFDGESRAHTVFDHESMTEVFPESGTRLHLTSEDRYGVREGDPLSAHVLTVRHAAIDREGWHVRVECEASMTATTDRFLITDCVRAWDGDALAFELDRHFSVPRRWA